MQTASPIAADLAAVSRILVVPKILDVISRTTGLRFTAVARVTDSTWTACAVHDTIDFGLKPGGELVLETTICNEIRQHRQPVMFGQASAHPEFATHATPKMYGFESYISIPIFRSDGQFFGTLCAIDPLPRKLDDPALLTTLELFAQLIGMHLDIEDRLSLADSALMDAHSTGKLREQFIAVLGHDLRNPLHAVMAGTTALKSSVAEPRGKKIVDGILRSCERMAELIDNVLDFARGRLGDGISISVEAIDDLSSELLHVIAEVSTAQPGHVIESSIAIDHAVRCDRRRLAQLFGNLLSNAIEHGAAGHPIRVAAKTGDDFFELSVENFGDAISSTDHARLFEPFERGTRREGARGLGLGLYICAEIAKAHGGTLTATSGENRITRFVFRMPLSTA